MQRMVKSLVLSTGYSHIKKAQRPTGEPEQFLELMKKVSGERSELMG